MNCPSCNQRMYLVKNLGTKKRGNSFYSVKRFHCDLCNIAQTKFGSGSVDEKNIKKAIDDSKKL